MSHACPSCRTNGADLDDPQGLCWECIPTDPNANADEARDCQGEWERDVAASGDTDFNTQTTEEA